MLTTDDDLRRVLQESHVIAVVGASDSPGKPAHDIPAYLQEHGYDIAPVNPARDELLGQRAFDVLTEIDRHVDVVQVFRPADEAPSIARQAVGIGASVLWLQEGIVSEDAARIAEEGGLAVVMDTCMRTAHQRLAVTGEDTEAE